MHVLSIIAALAIALSAVSRPPGTRTTRDAPVMTPFDGGGDQGGGSGGTFNGSGPPG